MQSRVTIAAGLVGLLMVGLIGCGGPASIGSWDRVNRVVTLPQSDCKPIMLDGLFSAGEWDDALVFETGPHSKMLFKQDADYIYIGVDSRDLIGPATNLFLAADSTEIQQFHISAQVGERKLTPESTRTDNPAWIWGYSDSWMANEVRWNTREMERLMAEAGEWRADIFAQVAYPSHGGEFQFHKTRFNSSSYYFRLDLIFAPDFDSNPEIFPEDTAMIDIAGWAELRLE